MIPEVESNLQRDVGFAGQINKPVSVAGLSREQRDVLNRVLVEPIEFVTDPSFADAETEQNLFGRPRVIETFTTTPWCNAARDGDAAERAVKTVVLTPERERRLFMQLNFARRRVVSIRASMRTRITAKAAKELLLWWNRSETARDAIIEANMPLVLAMAKRTRLAAVDYAELISEGNLALLRSVDKFDCGRGFKFSTYACRAILKSFSRVALRTNRYRGHFPTEFDPSLERSDHLEKVRAAEEVECVSELRTIMERNLAALNEIERVVIIERFALGAPVEQTPIPKTLEEVGTLIGVTKERVRQIQNRALQKLRVALENNILAA
ncbi:MAG: sigma-70 family RNA polymerase sigma factor [Phycisphaerae bacterium]